MAISKVPTEWHEEHQEKTEHGKKVLDGFVVGEGNDSDLVGTYTTVDVNTVLTISPKTAAWAIRIMAPRSMLDCLDAAVEAAVKLGVAER